MATTTTNFGWDIPQSTDLVKDGATAIATLGQDIDTALVDLKGGTTGQVLSKASNTDLDFTFTTIQTGGMTLLSTTSLTGASVGITGISTDYIHLFVYVYGVTNATANDDLRVKPNNSTSLIDSVATYGDSAGVTDTAVRTNGELYLNYAANNILRTDSTGVFCFTIYNYANTSAAKPFNSISSYINSSSNTANWIQAGRIETTSAITSLYFAQSGGDFSTGTVLIYGVK